MNAETPALSRYTVSFGVSLAAASVINGLLVVTKEKSPAVMAGMKRLTGHHWITHSAIVIALFFLLGWILAQTGRGGAKLSVNSLIRTMVVGVILGGLIIVGFYLLAD